MRSKIALALLIGLFVVPGRRANSHSSPSSDECTIDSASEDDSDDDDSDDDGMDFSIDPGTTLYASQSACEPDELPAALLDIRKT